MYESFYRLTQRPFAATPDARLFVATPAVADALTRLERCVRQGRGVAVLTGAAGIGKTHLLHRLFDTLQPEFGVIRVPNASFPSPRGLLQFLLAEIGESFERLGETELRLRLTAAAREARALTGGIVLLLDESHRYTDRLLEEVRLTANHVEDGQPLFRIVIAGQISLEDRLAEGGQSGLNERIGELVTLPRLTAEESRDYLATRASQAEGDIEELFEPEAIDIVIQACGGVPRCLNQLADHALLLGFVAERAVVSESLVREALEDLKRLPLQWYDPRPPVTGREGGGFPGENSRPAGLGDSEESLDDIVEIGSLDDGATISEAESGEADWATDFEDASAWDGDPSSSAAPSETPPIRQDPDPAPPLEPIADRFARLDAVDAQRRWLDAWERAAAGDEEIRESKQQPAPRGAAAENSVPAEFDKTDDEETTESEEQIADTATAESATIQSRQKPGMDDQTPETSPRRGSWNGVPKSATLFRDLRRRQGLT